MDVEEIDRRVVNARIVTDDYRERLEDALSELEWKEKYIDYMRRERWQMRIALEQVRKMMVDNQLAIGCEFVGTFEAVCKALEGYPPPPDYEARA